MLRNRSRSRSQSRPRSFHNRDNSYGYTNGFNNKNSFANSTSNGYSNTNGGFEKSSYNNAASNQYNGYQTYQHNSHDRGGRSYYQFKNGGNGFQNHLPFPNSFQEQTHPAPHHGNYYTRQPYSRNFNSDSVQDSSYRGSSRGTLYNSRGFNSRPYRSRSRSRGFSPGSHSFRPFSPRGRGSWQSWRSDPQAESVFLSREFQEKIAAEQKIPYSEEELFTPQAFVDIEDLKPPPAWSKPTMMPTTERFKTYITGFKEDLNPRRNF